MRAPLRIRTELIETPPRRVHEGFMVLPNVFIGSSTFYSLVWAGVEVKWLRIRSLSKGFLKP